MSGNPTEDKKTFHYCRKNDIPTLFPAFLWDIVHEIGN